MLHGSLTLLMCLSSLGATYYVAPTGSDAADGSVGTPWQHFYKLNGMSAGDSAFLRGGYYWATNNLDYFKPTNSGTALNPIVVSNFPSEVPIISGSTNSQMILEFTDSSYIKVFGLTITNCARPSQWTRCTNCELGYCTITWRGAVPFGQGDNYLVRVWDNSRTNWIHNCTISKGMIGDPNVPVDEEGSATSATYALVLGYYADATCVANLIENCSLNSAGHDVLTVGGQNNVIRSNWMYNAGWYRRTGYTNLWAANRCIESVGSEQAVGYPPARNLYEHNRIGPTGWVLDKGSAGHTIVDSHNIIRFNEYIGCNNFGIQLYDKTYSTPRTNRVYNNTFVYTGWCPSTVTNTTTGAIISDNYAYRGHVHVANVPTPGDKIMNCIFWRGWTRSSDGTGTNAVVALAGTTLPQFSSNFTNTDTELFANAGTPWYDNYNLDSTISQTVPDLHIGASGKNSLMDQGSFLTTISSDSGSGTSFTVVDPNFFCDGWGIPNVQGDLIQLQGQTVRVRITAVNYSTGSMSVDSSLTWTNGQGLALSYTGAAPDIGAYEYFAPVAASLTGNISFSGNAKIGP